MLKESTHIQQSRLASYCKTGIKPELIGVIEENLHHYRRLVFNIGVDTIETAYPITHSFLPSDVWNKLLHDFYAEHKCQTPQVWRMPLEFYEYCVEKNIQAQLNIPFLNDLLYFEWLELEIHTMDDIAYPQINIEGDILLNTIALNPEHKLIKLNYPVHIVAPTEMKDEAGDYFLLMYREKETGNIQFIDVSILYAYIIEQLQSGIRLQDILAEADSLFQINNFEQLKEHVLIFIDDLKKRNFILGFLN
ncbi:MAG: DNA-binding domain-containing protein [Bacteroidota bacterium]|nr:DNA-binding domain-containing protein [Bacteroidota bacterium]MDP3146739.1 DNA-binding domain-containing protein [Bacteroidota bacterium]